MTSIDPSTGETVGEIGATPVDDLPAVVARARAALPAWRALGAEGRREVLKRVAPRIEADVERLGTLLRREMGKPQRDAMGEVMGTARNLLGGRLDDMVAAFAPEERTDTHTRSVVYRDPYGVCAAITPWNFPVSMPFVIVLPALMAGNTVVLKPSELTPLVADAWVRHFLAELPEAVLQIVHGDEEQGRALVACDVDLVAFTGSREAGAEILASVAPTLKRVVLELGGKAPMIVLEGADLDQAAGIAAYSAFRNAGQVCVSTERIYVAESVADRFEQHLIEWTKKVVVGDGAQPDVDMGPMVSGHQKQRVVDQVRAALDAGAKLLCGDLDAPGNFLQPLVLARVDHRMAVMREETFGPVVGLMRFADDDEAVALANDTRYGLGAMVYGEEAHALAVARRLDAGMVGVNKLAHGASGTPWVGAKQSGYGFHSGIEGHRQFAQVRVVSTSIVRS